MTFPEKYVSSEKSRLLCFASNRAFLFLVLFASEWEICNPSAITVVAESSDSARPLLHTTRFQHRTFALCDNWKGLCVSRALELQWTCSSNIKQLSLWSTLTATGHCSYRSLFLPSRSVITICFCDTALKHLHIKKVTHLLDVWMKCIYAKFYLIGSFFARLNSSIKMMEVICSIETSIHLSLHDETFQNV